MTAEVSSRSADTANFTSSIESAEELEGAVVVGNDLVLDGEVVGGIGVEDAPGLTPEHVDDENPGIVCWYLIYYWLDTGEVFHVEMLFCEDPGEGGGGGDPEVTIELECSQSVTRGDRASCEIVIDGLETSEGSIAYSWMADDNGHSGTGESYSSWGGVATSDRTVSVTVTLPDTSATLEVAVQVLPRDQWRFTPLRDTTPDYFSGGSLWGRYLYRLRLSQDTDEGSGPWQGEYYVPEMPYDVTGHLGLHEDLQANGPRYGGTSSLPPSCGLVGGRASFSHVNVSCGYFEELNLFYRRILVHEYLHEQRINLCLGSTTANNLLKRVEAATGSISDVTRLVRDEIFGRGGAPGFDALLEEALKGRLPGFDSDPLWRHPRTPNGSWSLGPIPILGHGGTVGC